MVYISERYVYTVPNYLVENLTVRVLAYGEPRTLFIKSGIFFAKSRRTLIHVLAYHVYSLHNLDPQTYPHKGTSYHGKNYSIKEIDEPRSYSKKRYGSLHGSVYVQNDNYNWVRVPDGDVTPEMWEEIYKGGEM